MLEFPKRPRRFLHPILGRALEWTSRCGEFRIVRFLETEHGVKRFYATQLSGSSWLRLGGREVTHPAKHYTLQSAVDACQRCARRLARIGGSR